MGDLSKNFSRWEFACKGKNCCGNSAPVDPLLVNALQQLRDKIGRPIDISCGFRCKVHNAEVPGSASDSQHTLAKAADISVEDMLPSELFAAAEEIPALKNGGMHKYETFIHVDVRSNGPARW